MPSSRKTFRMQTSLDHLPSNRAAWIRVVADTIRKFADVEMIILYGSYARGDYVEDPVGNNVDDDWGPMPYYSDLDICVLTRSFKIARRIERSSQLRGRLCRPDGKMRLSVIAHTAKMFNRMLERGEFFYVDIAKEGVLLFDSGNFEISHPKNLTQEERDAKAQEDFDYWNGKAERFHRHVEFAKSERDVELAAFNLHQAAEHHFVATALVLSGYRPKGHDLDKLENWCAQFNPAFQQILPRTSPKDERIFKLLQAAYVGARYKKNFVVTDDDLEAMRNMVEVLRMKVRALMPE